MTGEPREPCPPDEELAQFGEHALAPPRAAAVLEHLEGCASCRALVAALAEEVSGPAPDDGALVPGGQVGRYRLTAKVGEGAMGEVFEAVDDTLQRTVAIKCLHREQVGTLTGDRLLEEARTLARLRHPHVVTVHDAGVVGERGWMAMELVRGQTLRTFLAVERPVATVLRVFREAAEGLAAAHTAGVIHRDVKPDNLLLDEGQRVRVSDFGLAALAGTSGEIAGTPAYMSPEQRAGKEVGPASDQYALAQCLAEALSLERTGARGRWRRGVSGRVLRAVARARSVDPADRFPSMGAFAAELQPSRGPRWVAVAAALVVLGVGGWVATRQPCAEGAALAHETWNEARWAAISPAFGQHLDAAALFRAALERWRDAWAQEHRAACLEARAGAAADEARARSRCLLGQRRRVDGLLALMASPVGEHAWAQAQDALAAIGRERCPSESRPDLVDDATQRALDQAELLLEVSQLGPALEVLERLQADGGAAKVGLRGALLEARGLLEREDARTPAALASARELAVEHGADLALEQVALLEARWAGEVGSDFARARAQLREAEQWLRRAGWRTSSEVELLEVRSAVESNAGDLDAALAASDRTRALLADPSVDLVTRARASTNRALVLYFRRQPEEALPAAKAAVDLAERGLGHEHDVTAKAYLVLGMVLVYLGDAAGGVEPLQTALALRRALGSDPVTIDEASLNLSNGLYEAGRLDEAEAQLREALRGRDPMLNPVGEHERALALVLAAQGRIDEAVAMSARAKELKQAHYGERHVEVAMTLAELGGILLDGHRLSSALAAFDEALRMDAELGAPADVLGTDRAGRARALLALGRREEARREADQALGLAVGTSGPLSEARLVAAEVAAADGDWGRAERELHTAWVALRPWRSRLRGRWLECRAATALGRLADAKAACQRAAALLAERSTVCDERASVNAWLAAH